MTSSILRPVVAMTATLRANRAQRTVFTLIRGGGPGSSGYRASLEPSPADGINLTCTKKPQQGAD